MRGNNIKVRTLSALLTVLMLAGVLAGCGQTAEGKPDEPITLETIEPVTKEHEMPVPQELDQNTPQETETTPGQEREEPVKQSDEPAVQASENPVEPKPEVSAAQETPDLVAQEITADVTELHEVELEEEAVALSDAPAALPISATAVAPGTLTKKSDDAVIDYSNTKDGYVMVQYTTPSDTRLKAVVKGPTTSYTYNLTAQEWAVFPLSDGNGKYQITVYKNVTGTKYAAVLSLTSDVALIDEFAPYLHSNQYVNYDAAPKTVAKAADLTKNVDDPLKKVEIVYDYVVKGMTYDKELAATVKTGYLPVLDTVLEKKSGICFDYAAMMTGMLRSQGVPCKLVVGYAGKAYHAWISVWTEGAGWVDGVIWFNGTSWQRMDPTFASSGNSSESIMAYIGDGTNYSAKYFY